MKRGKPEPFRRPPRRQEVLPSMRYMADVLEQVERSGCNYFVKKLSKTATPPRNAGRTATLAVPAPFVRENGDKIEQWVTLRTHLSPGISGRPWIVRLSVNTGTGRVVICGGFHAFVTANRLKEGDSLVFVLQEKARSEFEVYPVFRGSHGVPVYPDEGDSTSGDEEANSLSLYPSPLHHQSKRKKAFSTRDTRKGQATPSQNINASTHFDTHRVHNCKKEPTSYSREGRETPSPNINASLFDYHRVHKKVPTRGHTREWRVRTSSQIGNQLQNHRMVPFFRKRLTDSNIKRSDRDPRTNSGQFEIPERFLRAYARQIRNPVKLQGIHEDSRTHVMACRRRPGTRLRVDLLVTEWSRFVKENRLESGHELLFSLMADSYFLVRKVN